jgi:Flp pilus assembly protein TadD
LNESLGCAPLKGIIKRGFKYVELPRPELYDLAADPEEKVNLISGQSVRIQTLRQTLQSFEKAAGGGNFSASRQMSADERARLESLGYLSGQATSSTNLANLPDPKDAVHAWTLYQSGEQLLEAGQTAAAEEKFKSAVSENNKIVNAYSNLAEIYSRRGDTASIEKILAQGIAANPRNGTLRLRRLFYLFQLGRTTAVLDELAETEAMVPYWQREQFYNLAGITCGRARGYAQAVVYFKKVLAIEPANAEAAKNLGYALFMQERYAEALIYQRQAEKGLPQDPQLAADTAATLAKLRDYVSAGRYYEKALQLQPTEAVVLQYAGMLAEQKDYARAAALLKPYVERPAASPAFQNKARRLVHLWQGQ